MKASETSIILMRLLPVWFLAAAFATASAAAGREWFVRQGNPDASDTAEGSADHPLRTINAAAQLAQPGDVVTVGAGTYREWVSPARGGSAAAPIVYRSVPQRAVIVRGSDVLAAQWQPLPDTAGVFSAALPQAAFIFGNPFAGSKESKRNALVFLNDQPMSQVTSREQLIQTPDSWLASDDAQQILVRLQSGAAPAPGTIEITTRDRIFAPHRRGLGYIHVEGFVFERCAGRRAWPQLGALSTRTGDHWIIRNNIVRDTTGIGIDCGSETWESDTLIATEQEDRRILIGGNHLVEGNLITGNAECGIAAWNTESVRIIGNVVRGNASAGGEKPKPPWSLADAEAAGIKVHAFRHGLIERNLVADNASFGIWLDNGWENARVTRNITTGNRGAGIFVEFGFGPVLVDHNLAAENPALWPPYFGDGIYTHDASGVTIAHNTLLDNPHYGLEQRVAAERYYWPKRLSETSDETISGNLFYGNRDAAISLPLDSPRSHDNHCDHNAFEAGAGFVINNNSGRIPLDTILKVCRERLHAADVQRKQPPDSDPKRVVTLSLPQWRAVMQMDQDSTTLPEKLGIRLDRRQNVLQLDLPTADALPATPAVPADDVDLLGERYRDAGARAGAIQHLRAGMQTISLWPLPAASQPATTTTAREDRLRAQLGHDEQRRP